MKIPKQDSTDDNACRNSPTGKHAPNPDTVRAAYRTDGNLLVDVWCKHCGTSGSIILSYDDINW